MPRARAGEHQRARPKTALIEELTVGIAKFQEVVAAIKDLSQDGFPYRDAAQSKAELQFRECLRHAFGERSQEFQTYRNFKIRTGDKCEAAQCLAVIKGLIHTLEDRKLELQGLKPQPKPEPAPEANPSNTARLVLVSSATPATVTGQATSPITVAVAMTTNVGPPISPISPVPQVQTTIPAPHVVPATPTSTSIPPAVPAAPEPLSPPPAPTATAQSIPAAPEPPLEARPAPPSPQVPPSTSMPLQVHDPVSTMSQQVKQPEPSPPPLPTAFTPLSPPPAPAAPAQPTTAASEIPSEVKPAPPSPSVPSSMPTPVQVHAPASTASTQVKQPEPPDSAQPPPQDSPVDMPVISQGNARPVESALDQDPLHLIRKVCLRFHSVARQIRLRRDYRPTIEVEDDYDLQDLLCALLKVEFDEVATEEWTPPYTDGAPRTTLLVGRDQIAIIAKKTRPGLTTKNLADQVMADSAHYRAQGRCSILFCFMYDPEGRIGSPKRLETTLTSVSEHCRVEVLVAPK